MLVLVAALRRWTLRGGEAALADLLDVERDRQAERGDGRRGPAAAGTPASIRAPSVMSPEMPLKQSK